MFTKILNHKYKLCHEDEVIDVCFSLKEALSNKRALKRYAHISAKIVREKCVAVTTIICDY